ncbi:MAG: lamin tail domain-containing protein [Candidatus Izemoplasmatales bacterium]|jgi:hypothetical protein|nr:lamin tail domain-containing protein [Candidatus Izemoplasmatales bacterium]
MLKKTVLFLTIVSLIVVFIGCSSKTTTLITTDSLTTSETTTLTDSETTTITTNPITTAPTTIEPTTQAPTTEVPTTEIPTTVDQFLELANSLVLIEERDSNFYLPAELEYITITWSTNDTDYIEIANSVILFNDEFAYEVSVTNPTYEQGDQSIIITGTFLYEEREIQRDFTVLILSVPSSVNLNEDLALIQTSYTIEDEFALPVLNYSSYSNIQISSEIADYISYVDDIFTIVRPTEADAIGTISFTVSYGDSSEEVTINITIKKEIEVIEGATLIISQYVEGSSFNKYIELYNATSETINLSEYTIETYFNDKTTVGGTFTLSGTLAPGAVIVIGHPSGTIYDPDLDNGTAINFNGNDAIVLKHNGVVIDSIGQIGNDVAFAADVTLIRKPGITSGDTDPYNAYNLDEWIAEAQDSANDLGTHTA